MSDVNSDAPIIGKDILPFEVGYLPEVFQKKAAVELNESPELKEEKMKELKKLLKEYKQSKDLIFVDDTLLQHLRVKKYDAEKAFRQLKAYIVFRKKNPEIFVDLRFESLVETINQEIIYILPWRCPEGCTILVIDVDNWDPDTFHIDEIKRAIMTYFLSALRDPMTQVNGFKLIMDVNCKPGKILKQCTPNNLYLIYHALQNICPVRYREVHIINDSVVFKTVYGIIKKFLSEKIRSRIKYHKSSQTLINHFPRSILPKRFGGDLDSYDMSRWLRKMMAPEMLATLGGIRNWPSKN